MNPEEIKKKIQEARNQGVPDSVTFKYLNDKGLIPKEKIVQAQPVQAPVENSNNPTFAYTGQENPLQAGLKAAGNLPSSAYNLAKGLVSAVTNPIDTVKAIGNVAVGGVQKLVPGQQGKEESFDQFAKVLKDRYGSLDALAKTATEDPFAFGTDVLTLAGGGASLLGKTALLNKGISTVGKVATSPVVKTTEFVSPLVSKTSKYLTSQATGLNPETITELIKNPQAFKGVTSESRIQTANAVKDSLDTRLSELSGLGKEYQVLRDAPQVVTVPQGTIESVLNKYGVKIKDGQIQVNAESRPLSAVDKNAIQEFINVYGKENVLSSNGFLNTREALSKLAKYEQGKTDIATSISRDLRATYDELGKTQIKGLKEIDAQYAPERQLLSQVKKDIIDSKTGDLKDGAISKIANLTGKGKENLLKRMKEIVPDIEQRVKIMKSVEDIERTMGQKTGTYARAAITGGGLFTGNVPVIVVSILTQPQIAVPLLKGAGYVGQRAVPILNAVKSIVNDVNNFRIPSQLIDSDTGGLKAGLSIKPQIDLPKKFIAEDVAKKMDKFDDQILKEYIAKPNDSEVFQKMSELADNIGIDSINVRTDQLESFMKEVARIRNLTPTKIKVKAK